MSCRSSTTDDPVALTCGPREFSSMRPILRGIGLVVALGLTLPELAADNTAQDNAQLLQAGQVTGKLANLGSSGKALTLQVETQSLQANPGYNAGKGNTPAVQSALKHQAEALKLQEQILRTHNPLHRAALLQRATAQALQVHPQHNLFKVVTTTKDFDLQAADDVKVRMLNLPDLFDEKGNPKKYTADELKDLKGSDTKLPGYTSDFSSLKNGQQVTVYLSKPKSDAKDNKDDADNKDKKNAKPADKTPVITM